MGKWSNRIGLFLNRRFKKDHVIVFKAVSVNVSSGCKVEYQIDCIYEYGCKSYVFIYRSNFRGDFENSIRVESGVYNCFVGRLKILSKNWQHFYSQPLRAGVLLTVFSSKPRFDMYCENDFPDTIDDFYSLLDTYFGNLRQKD